MWRKLEVHYDDVSASVQAVLFGFQRLKPVESEDYKALVELVDEVEAAYCQLQELNHLDVLTMQDVDHFSKFLPSHVRVEWIRKYQYNYGIGRESKGCSQVSEESACEEKVCQTALSDQCW